MDSAAHSGETRGAFDVIVVGAGPAGSTLAALLGQRGRSVLLLDQAKWPREKTCGDGLSLRALAAIERLGVLGPVLAAGQKVLRAAIYSPRGEHVVADLPSSPGLPARMVVLPRITLDELLLRNALSHRAQFLEQRRVVEFVEERGRVVGVRGVSPEGPVVWRAGVVVLACGAASPLLRRSGSIDGRTNLGLAARAYFGDASLSADDIELHFDAAPLPGYSWLFPVNSRTTNVGAGSFPGRGRPAAARRVFESATGSAALARRLSGARAVGPVRSHPLHVGFPRVRPARPGLLLIGEAAGLVNPLTGEGVEAALESGELAAEVVARALAAGDSPEALAVQHARALRGRFLSVYVWTRRVRDLYIRPWLLDRLVAAAARRPELRTLLINVALGRENPVHALHPRVIAQVLAG